MNISGNFTIHRQLFDSTLSTAIDAIYMTVSVAVVICNSLICLMFYKDKSLRKPFNILLLNLSLGDFASAITIQPYIWIDSTKLAGSSAAGFLCAMSVGIAFFMVPGITNSLTITAITVFRYMGIVRNYQGRIVKSNTIIASYCVMTWLIGAGASIPSGLSIQYNTNEARCYRKWPQWINGSLYSLLITLLFLVIPVLVMIICYVALAVYIWKRSLEAPERNIAAMRARKRVAMLVGLLILAFFICWSPLLILWILAAAFKYFSGGVDGKYERQRLLRVFTIFALFNSALDPFIYTFSCPEYRKRVAQLICAPWRRKSQQGS